MTANALEKTYKDAIEFINNNKHLEAETLLKNALTNEIGDLNCERLLGICLMRQSKHDEAISIFKSMCERVTNSDLAILDLVGAYKAGGKPNDAIALLHKELDRNGPNSLGYALGDILVEQGRISEARKAYFDAGVKEPFRKAINDAKDAMSQGNVAGAHQIFEGILKRSPQNIEALCGMLVLATETGFYQEAEQYLHQLIKKTSYWPISLIARANLYMHTGRRTQARDILNQTTKIDPKNPIVWAVYGTSLDLLMQFEESIAAFTKSLELNPNQPAALLSLAQVNRFIGKTDLCIGYYKHFIQSTLNNGSAYWGLADLKTYKFSDDELADLLAAANEKDVPQDHFSQIHFALGKALEQRQDYDKAFKAYDKGNAIRQASLQYNYSQAEDEVERTIRGFTGEFLKKAANYDNSSEAPIFILGMPRAGSTLVEQILAAHSQVDATMELPFLSSYASYLVSIKDQIGPYPENAFNLAPETFVNFSKQFLKDTQIYRKGAPFFIDKMPNNFMHIGLIYLMFPNAKIIDMKRHPMDICLSLFKQHFYKGQSFSYSLENLGHFYNSYEKIMAHWNAVLPNKIHTVYYENLVNNTEQEIKQILEYCKLDMEDACLAPHLTKRAIRTSSSEQVKQPISNANIGYWHNFEGHLSELQSIMGEQIKNYENKVQIPN